jgi:hypothetical protein
MMYRLGMPRYIYNIYIYTYIYVCVYIYLYIDGCIKSVSVECDLEILHVKNVLIVFIGPIYLGEEDCYCMPNTSTAYCILHIA